MAYFIFFFKNYGSSLNIALGEEYSINIKLLFFKINIVFKKTFDICFNGLIQVNDIFIPLKQSISKKIFGGQCSCQNFKRI